MIVNQHETNRSFRSGWSSNIDSRKKFNAVLFGLNAIPPLGRVKKNGENDLEDLAKRYFDKLLDEMDKKMGDLDCDADVFKMEGVVRTSIELPPPEENSEDSQCKRYNQFRHHLKTTVELAMRSLNLAICEQILRYVFQIVDSTRFLR